LGTERLLSVDKGFLSDFILHSLSPQPEIPKSERHAKPDREKMRHKPKRREIGADVQTM
jgi:hypothetical protein